jgi:hypothetical protein
LIDGRDLWWKIDAEALGQTIAKCVVEYVLPFAERMHSRQAMARWLADAGAGKKEYPQQSLNLAILHGLLGERSKSCALLAELQRKEIGAWRTRAAEVATRMGCLS